MNLKNKIAVVTGATGGIGRAIIDRLDKEGVRLILVSRTESELKTLTKELKGRKNSFCVCDFSDPIKAERVAKEIAKKYTEIDILVNCAGVGIYKAIGKLSLQDWLSSINVGATSVFLFTKYLIPLLEKSSDSVVLTIGSGAGVIPMSERSAYCASKFAVRGLVLSLAEEFKRIEKPKFCLITLGSTLTSFGPMSFEERRKEMESGKAYFTTKWVSKKLTEILKDDKREIEYTLYPSDYGFGSWQPPTPLTFKG